MLAFLALTALSSTPPQNASSADRTPTPTVEWSFLRNGRTLAVRAVSKGAGFESLRVWSTAPGLPEALPTIYKPLGTLSYANVDASRANQGTVLVSLPAGACAVYAQTRYKVAGREFGLSSPTHVYGR